MRFYNPDTNGVEITVQEFSKFMKKLFKSNGQMSKVLSLDDYKAAYQTVREACSTQLPDDHVPGYFEQVGQIRDKYFPDQATLQAKANNNLPESFFSRQMLTSSLVHISQMINDKLGD